MIKGYVVPYGYMGYIDGRYELFATESEYIDTFKENENLKA